MGCEVRILEVAEVDVELLRKLVSDELDRCISAIDDIVVAGYGSYISMRSGTNRDAVKVAILHLVRSPLADMERKLGAKPVEVVESAAKVAV